MQQHEHPLVPHNRPHLLLNGRGQDELPLRQMFESDDALHLLQHHGHQIGLQQ